MTKQELLKIKLTKRWPIRFSDFFQHYFFLIIPVGCIIVAAMELYAGFKNDFYGLKIAGTIQLIISVLLLLVVVRRLYQNQTFDQYFITDLSEKNIKDALKLSGFKNIKHYAIDYYQCTAAWYWFLGAQEVTVIYEDNYLLINSRPRKQPITLYRDRHNIKTFLNAIKSVTNKVV